MELAKEIEQGTSWTVVEMRAATFADVIRDRLAVTRLFHSGWIIPGTIMLGEVLAALTSLHLSRDVVARGSPHMGAIWPRTGAEIAVRIFFRRS
jgi:hypothetical protein